MFLSIAEKPDTMHATLALTMAAPISRSNPTLPMDIIGTIFTHVFDEGLDPFPMGLREICKDWTDRIDSMSVLWSTLHIALQRLQDDSAQRLDEWVTRAGSHTLRIIMSSTFDDNYMSYLAVHIVGKIMRLSTRIATMRLDIPHYLVALLVNNTAITYSSLTDVELSISKCLWDLNMASPVLQSMCITQCQPLESVVFNHTYGVLTSLVYSGSLPSIYQWISIGHHLDELSIWAFPVPPNSAPTNSIYGAGPLALDVSRLSITATVNSWEVCQFLDSLALPNIDTLTFWLLDELDVGAVASWVLLEHVKSLARKPRQLAIEGKMFAEHELLELLWLTLPLKSLSVTYGEYDLVTDQIRQLLWDRQNPHFNAQ